MHSHASSSIYLEVSNAFAIWTRFGNKGFDAFVIDCNDLSGEAWLT